MKACCGLNCTECPTYLATRNNDDGAREKVARKWSKMFGMKLTAADINCDGCRSGSDRMFGYCRVCRIRSCCTDKPYQTCAECGEYPCNHLSALFQIVPQARKELDAIRDGR